MSSENKNIVIFDGDCGMCNAWVRIIEKADKNSKFRFISRNSLEAQKYKALEVESLIFVTDKDLYLKSEAVIKILSELGYPYKIAVYFGWIPKLMLDLVYDWIADNRNKFYKSVNTCYVNPNN